MATYKESPFGIFDHAHVNEPDKGIPGKFEVRQPEFKVDLRASVSDPAAVALMADIDAAVDVAFEDFKNSDAYSKMKRADKEELRKYKPYELEEDAQGEPTGDVIFSFRQNETLKLRDNKGTKVIKIGIYDAAGVDMVNDKDGNPKAKVVRVGPNSKGRVMYSIRAIPMPGLKKVGVRLDFSMVQITELGKSTGGGSGFSKVSGGGYAYDPADASEAPKTGSASDQADY